MPCTHSDSNPQPPDFEACTLLLCHNHCLEFSKVASWPLGLDKIVNVTTSPIFLFGGNLRIYWIQTELQLCCLGLY